MPEDRLIVTKMEAAERQVSEAIRLFFEERDPIAIHTLAGAAAQIAADLAEKEGKFAHLRGFEHLPPNKRSKWRNAIKSVENFFKHADRDPDARLEFPYLITRLYLAEATAVLGSIGSKGTVEMDVFQAWFILKYGKMIEFVTESKAYQHFNIPGTNLDDYQFFSCLIEHLNERDNAF